MWSPRRHEENSKHLVRGCVFSFVAIVVRSVKHFTIRTCYNPKRGTNTCVTCITIICDSCTLSLLSVLTLQVWSFAVMVKARVVERFTKHKLFIRMFVLPIDVLSHFMVTCPTKTNMQYKGSVKNPTVVHTFTIAAHVCVCWRRKIGQNFVLSRRIYCFLR